VQVRQEETYREIRIFDEHEVLTLCEPILKIVLKPKTLKFAGALALLAWLVIAIN